MDQLKPLPALLQDRYRAWKKTGFQGLSGLYRKLADEGQKPSAMVISCCDSRVSATTIFGANPGDFFVHRSIANLVPPYAPSAEYHGTSAAVEFAVTALNVQHLIVLGHSQCGGVKGCLDMCEGNAPQLEKPDSFVGRWMDLLKPKFPDIEKIADKEEQARAFEQKAIETSIENLMTFPYVKERVDQGTLSLHGLWVEIGEVRLEAYDAESGTFLPV